MSYTHLMADCDTIFMPGTTKEIPGIPILWQRNGLFRLIPKSVVVNAIDVYNTRLKTQDISAFNSSIRWEQGVDVDPKIAGILLGE